jgi:hypothetical protein
VTDLELAAYGTMWLHFAFLAFVVFGGLASLRFPRVLLAHTPFFVYALIIETVRFPCPLTLIEKDLRYLAGLGNYHRGFVGHYIEPYVSALGLPRWFYSNMGYFVVGVNVLIYALAIRRVRRTSKTPGPDPVIG